MVFFHSNVFQTTTIILLLSRQRDVDVKDLRYFSALKAKWKCSSVLNNCLSLQNLEDPNRGHGCRQL